MINYITIDYKNPWYEAVHRWMCNNIPSELLDHELMTYEGFCQVHNIEYDALLMIYRVPDTLLTLICLETNLEKLN